jgi:D-arabinose 1-dehydrogenase
LKQEHPRETYRIITKAGKFGPKLAHHDYSPTAIIGSVERSLKRFAQIHDDGVEPYLDVVCKCIRCHIQFLTLDLHDVEFVASNPDPAGFHLEALDPAHSAHYNLGALHSDEKLRSLGAGDDKILAALDILRTYQSQGKIRKVGLAGYSLPLLLRLSLLVLQETGRPLDIIQSYGHHNLLTSTLPAFIPYFRDRAQVKHIANASPFNMGILTSRGPPDWHPASEQVKQAARDVVGDLAERGNGSVKIETLASRFGMRELRSGDQTVPVVIGVKDFAEVSYQPFAYQS